MNATGKKGRGKKLAAELLLKAISENEIEALFCRAPEFYGPGKTKSFTNALIFENLQKGKKPKVFLKDVQYCIPHCVQKNRTFKPEVFYQKIGENIFESKRAKNPAS